MENLFTQKELILIGVSLIAGGACGTILKIIYDTYQARVQPVGYYLQYEEVDKGSMRIHDLSEEEKSTEAILLKSSTKLFMGRVHIINMTNMNMEEFRFGLTSSNDDVFVFVRTKESDRHHSIRRTTSVPLDAPTREVDFICKPFNRKDRYEFNMYVSLALDNKRPSAVKFSSNYPVKFVDLLVRQNIVGAILTFFAAFGGGPSLVRARVIRYRKSKAGSSK
jgi:hypothetical protein